MQCKTNLQPCCNTAINDYDEASMIPIHALNAIDKLLRELNIPFGGKIFVLGGDFCQVLPVMPHGS